MAAGAVTISHERVDGSKGVVGDGVNDTIACPNPFTITHLTPFTICGWFKALIDSTTSSYVLGKRQDATNRINFYLRQGYVRTSITIGGTTGGEADDTKYYKDKLVFVSISFDPTNKQLIKCVNQTIKKYYYNPTASTPNVANLYICSYTNAIFGKVFARDVRMFNKVLSEAELVAVRSKHNVTDGLVGKWDLETNYTDSSGYGNDGVNNGTKQQNQSTVPLYQYHISDKIKATRVDINSNWMICNLQNDDVFVTHIEN